jgi:hypothetical protein
MDQELNPSFELLGRRLALMRQLASSLEQVQNAVVRSDLRGIEGHTARQREICEALRHLENEALESSPREAGFGESGKRNIWTQLSEDAVSLQVRQDRKTLTQDLAQVEMRVIQLNQVYGALLRRARRTLQIFGRVLASSANTYALPKPEIPRSTLQEVSHV